MLCNCRISLSLARIHKRYRNFTIQKNTGQKLQIASVVVEHFGSNDLRFDYRVRNTCWFSFSSHYFVCDEHFACDVVTHSSLVMNSIVGFYMRSHGCTSRVMYDAVPQSI